MSASDVTLSTNNTTRPAFWSRPWVAPLLVFVLVLAGWELLVMVFQPPTFLLPPPSLIGRSLAGQFLALMGYGFNTFMEALGGFIIGCSLGLLVAMLVARSRWLSDLLLPFAIASNSVPIVAMAPIAIVWFGIGPGSKIAIVAVMCFFPTMVSTVRGLTSASPDAVALMHSYAASNWQIFAKLRVPSALPFVFNALKICTAVSMIGAIVAEFFGSPTVGLGFRISTEAARMNMGLVWAAITVASVAGSAAYAALVLLERRAAFWHPSVRSAA